MKRISNTVAFIIICIVFILSGVRDIAGEVRKTKSVHLLGLFGMSGAWPSGHACLPATLMAIDQVNGREDLLPEHRLVLHWNDTQVYTMCSELEMKGKCVPVTKMGNTKWKKRTTPPAITWNLCDGGVGTNVMFYQLYRPPVKTLVLGGGCSIATEPTARASHLWNLLQISYAAVSPALSDKKAFPRFLRTISPDHLINPAKIAAMKLNGWRRVATIHETFPLFSKVTDDLVVKLAENNMTLVTSEIFTDNPAPQVMNLKKHDARIILVGSYEENGARIMCEAYKLGLYGPKYGWLFPGWYSGGWWEKYPSVGCSPAQLAAALDGYIAFDSSSLNPNDHIGVAGITSAQFKLAFDRLVDDLSAVGVIEAPLAYDAIWAVALALNRSQQEFLEIGKDLEDFSYEDRWMADIILSNLWNVSFTGVKGLVYFDENGDSPTAINMYQMQDGSFEKIGIFLPSENDILWYTGIKWKSGYPPKDSTTYRVEETFVRGAVYLTVCIIAGIGVCLAGLLLVFNIVYRKHRLIKMSSPAMNNVILIGCVVTYLTVYLQETSHDNIAQICKTRSVTVMTGFSLSFGALFAKTWRVYVIFTNTTKRVTLRDAHLVTMVSVLVIIDVTISVVRELVDPLYVQKEVASTEELEHGDLVVKREIYLCTSEHGIYFSAIIYAYKGLMLVFGAFLAWQTRNVKIPALNDSKYIGMCIYNVTILSILGVILAFALDRQVELQYVLTSGFLICSTAAVQLIIFVPKIMKFRSVHGQVDSADEHAETSTNFTTTAKGTGSMNDGSSIAEDLKVTQAELEMTKGQLQTTTAELQATKAELEVTRKKFDSLMLQSAEKHSSKETH